ncbi:hypothetical protein MHYP_G00198300 [Metynnis hypsauchen]
MWDKVFDSSLFRQRVEGVGLRRGAICVFCASQCQKQRSSRQSVSCTEAAGGSRASALDMPLCLSAEVCTHNHTQQSSERALQFTQSARACVEDLHHPTDRRL